MKACRDCGFLALRNNTTQELDEAYSYYRQKGEADTPHHPFPVCFAMAATLEGEVNTSNGDFAGVPILQVIEKDRSDCPEWTPWRQGFSPKEHREMLIRQEEQDRNRALLQGLEDLRARREDRTLLFGMIAVGLLLVMATIVGPIVAALID